MSDFQVNSGGGGVPGKQVNPTDAKMQVIDWVLAILCSGIGCIVGIVYLIQGKPKGGMMLGVSIGFMVLWMVVNFLIGLAGLAIQPGN